MSDEEFTFDDDTKDVLKEPSKKKQGRPQIKKEAKKNKCINTYVTEDEYKIFMDFLEGRPASTYLRNYILEKTK